MIGFSDEGGDLRACLRERNKAERFNGELLESLKEIKELFRFALLSTTPEIAKDGMVFIRKAEAVIAKAERHQ